MKRNDELFGASFPQGTDGQHLALSIRVLQAAKSMRHIDELFLWLAQEMMWRLQVQVIQFWAKQEYSTGQFAMELRTSISHDASLPQYIVANEHVANIARRLDAERPGSVMLQPVGNIFSPHQTALLRRTGLHYWCGLSFQDHVLLPPTQNNPSMEKVATPLSLLLFAFLQHTPPTGLLPTISRVMEQAISIARSSGLLLLPIDPSRQLPSLSEVILHRRRDTESLRSSNPFTSTPSFSDRQVRRLYLAIDGQKSISALSASLRLPVKDILVALQTLLVQNHVQLFDPAGQLLDDSLLLNYLETGL